MALLFGSGTKKDIGGGFVSTKRPTVYGPGVIVLFAIFGLTFVLYAAFVSYRATIEGETEAVRSETASLERGRNKGLEADIVKFEKRVNVLSQLLRSHIYASAVFPILERVTLPSISYDGFSFDTAAVAREQVSTSEKETQFKVKVRGMAPSLLDLARQMIAYTEEPQIVQSNVSGFALDTDGGASFSADLLLAPDAILQNAAATP